MMIREALTKYVGSIEKVWKHDRSETIGASEIGACERKVYWIKKTVYTPKKGDPSGWGARTRGTIMEDSFWQPALKHAFKNNLMLSGPDQQSFVDGQLSSTPDGLLTNLPRDCLRYLGVKDLGPSQCILVECKTIDPRVNIREAKAENAFQVQVQLGIVRKKTKYKPDYALITYVDASFWDDVKEFPIKFDPVLFASAQARAKKILSAKHPRELMPEGWVAGGNECEYCPFTKECGVMRRSIPEKEKSADPQFIAEVTDMANHIIKLETALKESDARLRTAREEMKDRLRDKGVRKIPGIVVWSYVKGRQSYDNVAIREAAEAAGVDTEVFSTVGEPTDRLQILLNNSEGKLEKKANGKAKRS